MKARVWIRTEPHVPWPLELEFKAQDRKGVEAWLATSIHVVRWEVFGSGSPEVKS